MGWMAIAILSVQEKEVGRSGIWFIIYLLVVDEGGTLCQSGKGHPPYLLPLKPGSTAKTPPPKNKVKLGKIRENPHEPHINT